MYCYGMDFNPPQPYVAYRTWNTAYGQNLPFFDLTQPNPDWWEKFRYVHKLIKQYGLTAYGVLHDHCSLRVNRDIYPFIACIQKVNPDTYDANTPGGFYGLPASWESEDRTMSYWHKKWFEQVINELNSIGVNYCLEIINEATTMHPDELNKPEEINKLIAWNKWAADTLISLGVPKEKLLSSSLETYANEWSKQVGIYSFHGVEKPDRLPLPIERLNEGFDSNCKILISGDGGWEGDGLANLKGERGPSNEQAKQIAKKISTYEDRYIGYEHPPKECVVDLKKWNDVDKMDFSLVKSFAEVFGTIPTPPPQPTPREVEVCKTTGLLPNDSCPREKHLYLPGEEPTKTCAEKHKDPSCYEKFIKGRKLKNWNILGFLECLFSKK
jgi:hypothetical protein